MRLKISGGFSTQKRSLLQKSDWLKYEFQCTENLRMNAVDTQNRDHKTVKDVLLLAFGFEFSNLFPKLAVPASMLVQLPAGPLSDPNFLSRSNIREKATPGGQ
ncbi:unnamed protein product [Larinioides sclopetarius]|uniref:Uncharacterized protein n=1 Tax=Larinioides sclopetarius TaxID=280406 RepID=A0AAV2B0S5_9ARAC